MGEQTDANVTAQSVSQSVSRSVIESVSESFMQTDRQTERQTFAAAKDALRTIVSDGETGRPAGSRPSSSKAASIKQQVLTFIHCK